MGRKILFLLWSLKSEQKCEKKVSNEKKKPKIRGWISQNKTD